MRSVRDAPAGRGASCLPATNPVGVPPRPTVTDSAGSFRAIPEVFVTVSTRVASFGPPNHELTDTGASIFGESRTGGPGAVAAGSGALGAPAMVMGTFTPSNDPAAVTRNTHGHGVGGGRTVSEP